MSGEAAKVWSVGGWTLNFDLFLNLNQGASEDGIAEIEPSADDFTVTIGADGSVVWNQTGNQHFIVTLKVLATSAVNTGLSVIRALGTSGVGPFFAKNNNGLATLVGVSAVILAPPKIGIGKEVGTNEWKIGVQGTYFPAGA
jgi:hypothetical protein